MLQEEEMRRAAQEKQRAEDEEAAKWMNMISVEQTVRGCMHRNLQLLLLLLFLLENTSVNEGALATHCDAQSCVQRG
jgi:hypothetical protein